MSSAVPQADEEKVFPVCTNHPNAEVSELGTFWAGRGGVAAELSISTCQLCRPMKKSFGRHFRAKLSISAPGLDSFREFIFQRDFEFVSDVRAWTLGWIRGGLAHAFFDWRDEEEKRLLNRDQTFVFVLSEIATQMEERLLEFYD